MEKNPISAAVILVGQIDKTSNKLTLVSKYGTNQLFICHLLLNKLFLIGFTSLMESLSMKVIIITQLMWVLIRLLSL